MFLRLEFPTFLTITLDPIFKNGDCGVSVVSIYKSSINGVGNGVEETVGVGVGVAVGTIVSVGVGVGVLEGVKVNVGIGVSVGVTSISFFFQDL